MAADVRQAVDHSERLIEALLVLARNDQARALTDPLDLAAVAEDALEGRTANGITTTTTLGEAPVTATQCCSNGSSTTCSTTPSATTSPAAPCPSRPPPTTARPWCESSTPARSYHPGRSNACSCRSPGSTTAPATMASVSASPSSHDRHGPQRNRARHRRPRRGPRHHRPPPATRQPRHPSVTSHLNTCVGAAFVARAGRHSQTALARTALSNQASWPDHQARQRPRRLWRPPRRGVDAGARRVVDCR